MHKICKMRFLVLFLLCCNFSQAQKLSRIELLDAISSDFCNEVTALNEQISNEGLLGIYMLKSIGKYQDEVTYYFGKDFFSGQSGFDGIGEELGVHLALKCPDIFTELFERDSTEIKMDYLSVSGKLIKIQRKEFLTFTLKESTGKTHDFILLNNFDTSYLLTDNILKTNDEIEVSYYVSEIYNAKIGKYVNYNIVTYIEKI